MILWETKLSKHYLIAKFPNFIKKWAKPVVFSRSQGHLHIYPQWMWYLQCNKFNTVKAGLCLDLKASGFRIGGRNPSVFLVLATQSPITVLLSLLSRTCGPYFYSIIFGLRCWRLLYWVDLICRDFLSRFHLFDSAYMLSWYASLFNLAVLNFNCSWPYRRYFLLFSSS